MPRLLAQYTPSGASATALNITGFNSLAGGSFATSDVVDNSANLYIDYLVELLIASITPAGNGQLVAYVISSIDGTNYGQNSGSNFYARALLGVVPMPSGVGPWRSQVMSVAQAFGGTVPPYFKIVVYNDNSSTALAGSGNSCQYKAVNGQSA